MRWLPIFLIAAILFISGCAQKQETTTTTTAGQQITGQATSQAEQAIDQEIQSIEDTTDIENAILGEI